MAKERVRGLLWNPRNLTSFQHFNADSATELALELGRLGANLASQDAADAWFAVGAKVTQGTTPPNQLLEARCSAAFRSLAKAMNDHADAIDAATEAQSRAVDKAKENASGKQKPGGPTDSRVN